MTIGEEHEQVFSKISRYGYVTKHMKKQGFEHIFCNILI